MNHRCSDGSCGARDCDKCFPGCHELVKCRVCGRKYELWEFDDYLCDECCANFEDMPETGYVMAEEDDPECGT